MTKRFAAPIAWAVGLGLFCARAGADASLPPLEAEAQVARARAFASVGAMESAARRVRVILQRARARQQAAEVNCANEGLSRVDVALRAGRDHAGRLADAWRRGDAVAARDELARVALASLASQEASARARQCIAEPQPAGTTIRLLVDPQD